MSIFVPQARNITWDRWCSEFSGHNPTITNIPWPLPETQWRRWASMLQEIPDLQAFQVPWPEVFTTWQEWANRLLEALDGYN